ncbi:hypothetical protein EUX98_g1548 [Antrodiella citrinella]|uniref:Uncharacterized protein n=1 Tax=Antrodiella citrinella TaxID=2447956 RepID=A0A4S4N161_9APHY|nr:hypothetical protein EUX98_g1548 [Antrodiella citrinella]
MDTPANVPNPTIVSGSVVCTDTNLNLTDMNTDIAPQLLAHLFNWGLFGVLSVQVYLYYVAFPHDPRGLKSVVAAIFLLELTQTILLTHDAFRVYASGWGNTADLDSMGLYWFSIPVLGGLISALTQLFYAWRIHMLSGSYWAAGVISVVAVAQGVNEIYDGVLCLKTGSFSQCLHGDVLLL